MKRRIIAILWFVAVAASTLLWQRFTVVNREFFGYFAATPDFVKEVLSGSIPLSTLAASFLVQLFYYPALGALICACIVTGTYLAASFVFRSVPSGVPACIAAGACWIFTAVQDIPSAAVLILLISCVLCIPAAMIDRKTGKRSAGSIDTAVCVALVAAGIVYIAASPSLREKEQWAKLEVSARNADWDTILEVADRGATLRDSGKLPYALLALNAKGQLHDRIAEYPVREAGQLDMESINSREAFYFNSLCYDLAGCFNEAMHMGFQTATFLPHYMSLGLLRNIIRYSYNTGHRETTLKYCDILSKTLLGGAIAAKYRKLAQELPERYCFDGPDIPVKRHEQFSNLLILRENGDSTTFVNDRIIGYLMTKQQ